MDRYRCIYGNFKVANTNELFLLNAKKLYWSQMNLCHLSRRRKHSTHINWVIYIFIYLYYNKAEKFVCLIALIYGTTSRKV